MAQKVNLDTWLTKAEATAITGLSMRALERLIEDGTIARQYRKQPGKRSMAVLHPQDVEQLRVQATPINPQVLPTVQNGNGDAGAPALRGDPISRAVSTFLSIALPQVTQQQKRFLTIEEASTYTGLPTSAIETAIRKKKLIPIYAGKPRAAYIRRTELDTL